MWQSQVDNEHYSVCLYLDQRLAKYHPFRCDRNGNGVELAM